MAVTDEMFELGRTLKPHGLKGEVAIKLDVDVPKHYAGLDMVWVERQGTLVPYTIESIAIRPKTTVVQFHGVDDIEAATALSGHRLLLPVAALPTLTGLKFYYHEVVGFALEDERFGSLGTILTVMDLPGNPLFKTELKESEGFFPIKDETLVSVNREAKTIVVSMPEGLPELYFDNAAL
ncbi:ribosome maturation factor RimM [Flavobacteriales bacterium]|jgi:16S rRNA processing protein RimM|nr:ribosome maturation factor RimM [Flavobacteriales bacterium]MDA9864514.1 ribosome maturation factor RimM [Flavobacteriales bacterium]